MVSDKDKQYWIERRQEYWGAVESALADCDRAYNNWLESVKRLAKVSALKEEWLLRHGRPLKAQDRFNTNRLREAVVSSKNYCLGELEAQERKAAIESHKQHLIEKLGLTAEDLAILRT